MLDKSFESSVGKDTNSTNSKKLNPVHKLRNNFLVGDIILWTTEIPPKNKIKYGQPACTPLIIVRGGATKYSYCRTGNSAKLTKNQVM